MGVLTSAVMRGLKREARLRARDPRIHPREESIQEDGLPDHARQ
jgi:hypothetical protein